MTKLKLGVLGSGAVGSTPWAESSPGEQGFFIELPQVPTK